MMDAVKDAKKLILYVNFNEASASGMFRRRLDGIRRCLEPLGFTVGTLGSTDCHHDDAPKAIRRIAPAGCVVEAPFMRPGFFAGTPAVFFDPPDWKMWRGAPMVVCDERAVAEAAFRELSAGLPPVYAVVLYWMFGVPWATRRAEAFADLCRKAGKECLVFQTRHKEAAEERIAHLRAWVAALPHRCAVFAVNDGIARDVADAFLAAGRTLPHSATLVGANAADRPGDSAPAMGISSVKIDFELSGFLAGKMLLEQMGRGNARQATPLFGPLLVERRKSTRGWGRREPFILQAVDTIRREACDGLTPDAVIRRSQVSKRLFTLRFREAMGHSVHDEIMQVRLERVFSLLAETDTPIGAISDMCGFGSQIELRKVFRARTKMSMTEWRALRR